MGEACQVPVTILKLFFNVILHLKLDPEPEKNWLRNTAHKRKPFRCKTDKKVFKTNNTYRSINKIPIT